MLCYFAVFVNLLPTSPPGPPCAAPRREPMSETLEGINRYEEVLIAAREARRLNDLAKNNGRELKRRPTQLAWERLQDHRVKFTYEPEKEPEPFGPAEPAEEAAVETKE